MDYCSSHISMYCYGAGKYGRIIRTFLAEHEIGMDGYIISREVPKEYSVLDLSVYSLENYIKYRNNDDGIIIGLNEGRQKEVVELLSQYAINDFLCVDEDLVDDMERNCSFESRYDYDNNITVFCYHRVADIPLDTWRLAVSPKLFEQQMQYIKENYTVLRSEDDWNSLNGKPAAVITFDDGYEDSFTNALPILEKHDIPATVFVCTGNLGTSREFWWDELERVIFFSDNGITEFSLFDKKYSIATDTDKKKTCYDLHPILKCMDYNERGRVLEKLRADLRSNRKRVYCHSLTHEQLRKLSESPLITIGGHTVTHSSLGYESDDMQRWEIDQSKKEIESIIDKELTVFSYPFGQIDDFSDTTIRIAEKCGYKRIYAAYPGITKSDYKNGYIPRINIGQERDYEQSIRRIRYYTTLYGNDLI